MPLLPEPPDPRVSVIVPSFNATLNLPAALESALQQTVQDFEVLVVDDGSPGGTFDLAEEFARRDPRICVDAVCILPMFRRRILRSIGVFDDTMRGSEDYDFQQGVRSVS